MKIAIIINNLSISGGAQRQAIELALELTNQGHVAKIFCLDFDLKKCFPEKIKKLDIAKIGKKINLKKITPKDNFGTRLLKYTSNLINTWMANREALRLYRTQIKKEQFDLYNYHDSTILFLAKASPRKNNSWMMNDPPSLIDAFEKQILKYQNSWIIEILIKLTQHSFKKQLHNISKIVVLDKRNKKIVKHYFKRQSKIIRSGIDLDVKLNKTKPRDGDKINILTTNILFPYRRYEDVIRALNIVVNQKEITNIHYWIVGETLTDEEYYKKLVKLVRRFKLNKYVSFLGSVSEKKLKQLYGSSDIFIFPNFNQTWGLSVFEAMLHGCAVIVSDRVGAHDVLTHSQNSLVYQAKNTHVLADLIILLIKNKSKRDKLAKAGSRFVQNNLSWKKYATNLLAYIR